MKSSLFAVSSLALLVAGAVNLSAQMTGSLYGLTFFNNQLVSLNPATGRGTLVANLNQNVTGYGLAFRSDRLYTFDPNTDRIREINMTTGLVGSGINIGVGNLIGEGDLAFRSDGMGFLSSALAPDFSPSNDLFRFDLDLGTSVRLGRTSVVIDAMAFDNNTLYAIGQESMPSLYTVNQSTAALTMVGSLGLAVGSPFSGMTMAPDGRLYAALNDRLYTINKTTGAASVVDVTVLNTGFASVSGLAWMTQQSLPPITPGPGPMPGPGLTPIPEPSTYGLFAVAGLGALVFLRRKQQNTSALAVAA